MRPTDGMIARRAFLCGFALLVSGCVYFSKHTIPGACADSLDSPVRNFCVARSQVLWRGERPTKGDAAWLLEHRVGTIVNLEVFLDDHRAFDAAAVSADFTHTVDYFHTPDFEPVHMVNWSLLDHTVTRFSAIVSQGQKPVYVHCLDGIDRTGVLIAAYRVLIEGSSPENAIAEMAHFQSPWLRVDARYIRSLEGDRRAQLVRKIAESQAKLTADAKITCSGGKCRYARRNGAVAERE